MSKNRKRATSPGEYIENNNEFLIHNERADIAFRFVLTTSKLITTTELVYKMQLLVLTNYIHKIYKSPTVKTKLSSYFNAKS